MKTTPSVTSGLRLLARVAALGGSLALAGCGQNWSDSPGYVSVGGSVSGLTGTVVLQNKGQDDLAVTANGSFHFALQIKNGASYAVTVKTQPIRQFCTVTNGSGAATANVASVTVTCRSNVTIGGTIAGLTGTVVLQNNGGNSLATAANGPFTFTASIPPGSAYAVSVQTQPLGQYCSVANNSGTASADVTNVAVDCRTVSAGLRALPAIYTNGKAVNYSAYRYGGSGQPAGGPGSEVPTDAQVLEDLRLLHAAGFNLIRLFAADVVSEKILRLALANYPDMQFQLGAYIFGINAPGGAGCGSNPQNSDPVTGQLARVVLLANSYANVATVSVGNETSFFRTYMPVGCLVGYLQTVRSQIAQPVTADDDYTFYCSALPECNPAGSADPVLAIIDFVSIHTYPMSNPSRWDWVQAATAAGPGRAKAMMEASLVDAKSTFAAVANKTYVNAAGATVSVGASLPIVIGETGWKARQTNYSATAFGQIEQYAATEINAKWYFDLLYGSAPGASYVYPSWQGSSGGPLSIFYFEAFDETWKGEGLAPPPNPPTDDGWGLWGGPSPTTQGGVYYGDFIRRQPPRYALCGYYASFTFSGVTYPAAPACNNPETYPGAGFHP